MQLAKVFGRHHAQCQRTMQAEERIVVAFDAATGDDPCMTDPERSAPDARAAHEPPVHLTFAEAAARLHITPNAVRMRVHRGTLASIRVNDCTLVIWPQPESDARTVNARTRDARSSDRASMQDDRLVARLESEVAYLRAALDAEIEARRRADHLVAALMERLPELPATVEARKTPQDANPAPQRGDTPAMNYENYETMNAATDAPASGAAGLAWRLWRRLKEH